MAVIGRKNDSHLYSMMLLIKKPEQWVRILFMYIQWFPAYESRIKLNPGFRSQAHKKAPPKKIFSGGAFRLTRKNGFTGSRGSGYGQGSDRQEYVMVWGSSQDFLTWTLTAIKSAS